MELLTRHARARMQQRGIRFEDLEALLDFGREVPAGGGRDLVFFDKCTRARLARSKALPAAEADRLVRSYAIVGSDGSVITVGRRYRRIPR
ncbi:MAG TPA: DUF4258 domain-containing protein [Burkholderiales bacterium]|nr:DUF4258 domain-containing protein [Burkholderiales bacterium]